MRTKYRFFIDSGADAVVGHHPHWYSGFEEYNGCLIFYSLGNFIFDNDLRDNKWNKGFAVRLSLENAASKFSYEIIPYTQGDTVPGLAKLNHDELQAFNANLQRLNSIISNEEQVKESFDKFLTGKSVIYKAAVFPINNKYINGFFNRFKLPFLMSLKGRLKLLNLIRCESHREILIKTLEKSIS
jgi:poly-gamma-glutamate synthesis protein (capsule biosynthesis protein)